MESVKNALTSEEKDTIEEFHFRFKNTLTTKLQDDSTLFYRFLKARDFDVNKAEAMLRNHIAWRKAFQVDTILETFKPKEAFRYVSSSLMGYAKDGSMVKYAPSGKVDIRDATNCLQMNDLIKHWIWVSEEDLKRLKEKNLKTGKDAFQAVYILNLEGCTLSNITHKSSADLMIRITVLLQDNFPERMKAMYIINVPVYFTIMFSIVKRLMSNAMLRKIHVFAQSGWKDALLEIIDADELPVFLGGNRTDPDGNPLCQTFIHHGGRLSQKYFLTNDERDFKDITRVQKVHIQPKDSWKVPVYVEEAGSAIQWEFEIKNKDISFGIFYQISELKLEELSPSQRYITSDGVETGSFIAPSTGTYVVLFDNSHSWWSSKEVKYCLTVKSPE